MPESNSSDLEQLTNEAVSRALNQGLGESARRKMLGLIAADSVLGMGLAARSHGIAERLARKTQDGTLGIPTEEPADELLANMHITVGDTIHISPPPPPAPVIDAPAAPAAAAAPAEPAGAAKKVWPYVLAAALASGGLGAAAAALPAILSRWPVQQSQAASVPATLDDSDTHYELRISSGDLDRS